MERIAERERDMREPTIKDRIVGCACCLRGIVLGFITWNFSSMLLHCMLLMDTAAGRCEVIDTEEDMKG